LLCGGSTLRLRRAFGARVPIGTEVRNARDRQSGAPGSTAGHLLAMLSATDAVPSSPTVLLLADRDAYSVRAKRYHGWSKPLKLSPTFPGPRYGTVNDPPGADVVLTEGVAGFMISN
jgi:hypothetical protein